MNTPFHHDGLAFNLLREGRGAPVIFQHGLCGNAAQTNEVFPPDERFKLLTLECRGHGASEVGSPDYLSIATFASDVAAMAGSQAQGPVIVGGISMGAAIALHLGVHHRHHVKALVLARPAWVTAKAPENLAPNAEVGALLARHSAREAKDIFLGSDTARHLARHAPDNLASLTTLFSREPTSTTAALLQRIAADGPGVTEREVRGIAVPTLIIATHQDVIHPVSTALALHAMLPQARLVMVTPKGEDRQKHITEFRAALVPFLEENA